MKFTSLAVLQTYRRVIKKVHPDKGGKKRDFQKLQAAKEAWDTARNERRPSGNPAFVGSKAVVSHVKPEGKAEGYMSRKLGAGSGQGAGS